MSDSQFKFLFRLLQVAVIAVFLGRAWQHLVWDAPFRALLWDEYWMKSFVEGWLGYTWDAFVSDPIIDARIQNAIWFTGCFYIICALTVFLIHNLPKLLSRLVLSLGGISLVILAFLYCKEHFFFIGQFFEYALQWGSPFFLLAALEQKKFSATLILFLKIATALTFICHGLYAMGYYPRPGYFVEMVMNILGVSESQAINILNIAGVLDLVLSVLIFMPRKWAIPALAYAVFWGFGTSIARVWAYFRIDFWQNSLNQWLHETIYRFPHFIIPLILLFIYLWRNKNQP